MSKYIDAEKLKRHYAWWDDESKKIFDEIIDLQPAADVVEVVRCKDCMFWRQDRISCEGYAMCQTGEGGIRFRRENDYCSIARRRTDE